MSRILILGGTRNLGHVAATHLMECGHTVAVLNRGITPDELPAEIERIRATRGTGMLQSAVGSRDFDLILDLTTYNRDDAIEAVQAFRGKAKRYVFISSGQVYLVRDGAHRPFQEDHYAGGLMIPPASGTSDFESWKYGADKRDAEEVFNAAWADERFPVTTLRLPMVASHRDSYGRIQGYLARLFDGGPILIPDEEGLPIRHVYVNDVARVIALMCDSSSGIGGAFNISFGQSMFLRDYLTMLGNIAGKDPATVRAPRTELETKLLLPDCSPFSGTWMSELDGSRAGRELIRGDFEYSRPEEYLAAIVDDYRDRWVRHGVVPATYRQRGRELAFARNQQFR